MPEWLVDLAPWIAVACAIAALAGIAVMARRAWRQWRRLRVVQDAAGALIDVHAARVDEAIARVGRHSGTLADRGEGFADLLAQLKADVEQLRWLLARIPEERERLTTAVGDLLLPTDRSDRDGR